MLFFTSEVFVCFFFSSSYIQHCQNETQTYQVTFLHIPFLSLLNLFPLTKSGDFMRSVVQRHEQNMTVETSHNEQ